LPPTIRVSDKKLENKDDNFSYGMRR
jgi:hypothetical protein